MSILFDFRYCVPPYPEYVEGIAIKLTQGKSFVNPLAHRQANGGVPIVAHWHYWEPGVDAKLQAANYWNVARNYGGDLFGDFEHPYAQVKGSTPFQIKTFIEEVERLSGRTCGIYTRRSWWAYRVGVTTWAGSRPLWVAHYAAAFPAIPIEWANRYDVWQFQGDVYWPGWIDSEGHKPRVDVDHLVD